MNLMYLRSKYICVLSKKGNIYMKLSNDLKLGKLFFKMLIKFYNWMKFLCIIIYFIRKTLNNICKLIYIILKFIGNIYLKIFNKKKKYFEC